MTRTVSTEVRLEKLVQAATSVFIRSGFRKAQMADVAREMGVATGTVYLYVESKEALFDLVMSRFPKDASVWPPPKLPVPTPATGATLNGIRQRLLKPGRLPILQKATGPQKRSRQEMRGEFERVIRELYARVYEYRLPILLLERSAADWPELSDLYHKELRPDTVGMLEKYLEHCISKGHMNKVPNVSAAARFVLETIVWFARYRFASLEPIEFNDHEAEETVVCLLLSAFGLP